MIELAASLWSVPNALQEARIQELAARGLRRLHWDYSDGTLARRGGFTPPRVRSLTAGTTVAAEAHLMALQPTALIDEWADFCDRIVVHAECEDLSRALARIERRNRTAVLAVSPGFDIANLPSDIPVLCMAIRPGNAGSTFNRSVLQTIAQIRDMHPDRLIGVDGGVRFAMTGELLDAGVNWVVVGTDLAVRDDRKWDALLESANGEPVVRPSGLDARG